MEDDRYEIRFTVLVDRTPSMKTVDDAVDAVGERLHPWAWVAEVPMDAANEQ